MLRIGRPHGAVLLFGALVVIASGFVAGQSGAPPASSASTLPSTTRQTPVFRGGATFVSVDVYPRRNGQIVTGLTAADFEVFEDGKPQAVDTFEFIQTELSPVDADRRDPSSQAEGDRLARDPHNRVFVIYLDLAHTTRVGSLYATRPLLDFVKRTIGKTDLFGFMTPELPAGQLVFGRRTEVIESQLSTFQGWGQADEKIVLPRNAIEERLMRCTARAEELIGAYRMDLLQTSLENLVMRLGDLRDERKHVLFVSEGWVPRPPSPAIRALVPGSGQIPRVGVGPGGRIGIGGTDMFGRPDESNWCNQMVSRLANQDYEERFRRLLTSARRANVAFYPIDVGGLRVSGGLGGAVDTLRTLAENTDGRAVVNTNDIEGAVRAISTDLSSFYLLGYYSTNPAMDGRFREIQVKVKQAGVQVSARRGYVELTPEAFARGAAVPSAVPPAVEAALARLVRLRDDTDVFLSAVPVAAGIEVTAEVSARVTMAARSAPGTLTITAVSGDADPLGATVALAAGQTSARTVLPVGGDALRGPWRVSARLEAPGGPYSGRVDLDAHERAGTLVGAPAAFRGPANPRQPVVPAADLRLRRAERLRVEWPVIEPAATLSLRLLGRNGQALGVTLPPPVRATDGGAARMDLPLSALPEADFVLELSAAHGDSIERRLLAFRVTR